MRLMRSLFNADTRGAGTLDTLREAIRRVRP